MACIWKQRTPAMKAAKRARVCLPQPPTPTSMALPRGCDKILAMLQMCCMASGNSTAGTSAMFVSCIPLGSLEHLVHGILDKERKTRKVYVARRHKGRLCTQRQPGGCLGKSLQTQVSVVSSTSLQTLQTFCMASWHMTLGVTVEVGTSCLLLGPAHVLQLGGKICMWYLASPESGSESLYRQQRTQGLADFNSTIVETDQQSSQRFTTIGQV